MIRFFKLFSGLGNFRVGPEQAVGFTCVSHADKAYRAAHPSYADRNARHERISTETARTSVGFGARACKQAGNAAVVHTLGLRLKAAHGTSVAATGARKEAA